MSVKKDETTFHSSSDDSRPSQTKEGALLGKSLANAASAARVGQRFTRLIGSKAKGKPGVALAGQVLGLVIDGATQALADKAGRELYDTRLGASAQPESLKRSGTMGPGIGRVEQNSQGPNVRMIYRAQTLSTISSMPQREVPQRSNTYPMSAAEARLQASQSAQSASQPSLMALVAEAAKAMGPIPGKGRQVEPQPSIIEQVSKETEKVKRSSKVKLPVPDGDGTYTMKQVCGCIDTDINFNVEKKGNTYELSVSDDHKGRFFYQANSGLFPIKVKLAAGEENYREMLDKGKMQIKALTGEVAEVKPQLARSSSQRSLK